MEKGNVPKATISPRRRSFAHCGRPVVSKIASESEEELPPLCAAARDNGPRKRVKTTIVKKIFLVIP
jgi:hypothetical protein